MRAFILSLSLVLLAGCNMTNSTETPTDTSSDATATIEEALTTAINDEYHAEAIYAGVLADFGDVRPFSNIINAEQKHSARLAALFESYELVVPENTFLDSPEIPHFDSVTAACAAAETAEIKNVALYDELLENISDPVIVAVFQQLQRASQENHLPAFQRCGSGGGGMGRS